MTLHATFAAAGLALALSAGLAAASTLVVDRGLPADHLNNAAGADRSNVAWGFDPAQGAFQSGDTFSLAPVAGPGWQIDRLTGWVIAGSPDDDSFALEDRFSAVSLYLGAAGPAGLTSIDKVASSTITGSTADAANVIITPVTYAGGANYQGTSGSFIRIWQIDFLDLGLFAAGDYLFSIAGLAQPNTTSPFWFNHASNAGLGGVPAEGADGQYAWFSGAADAAALTLGGFFDSDGNGWDKSSDINVQVWATAIPVPAALPLLGGGLALLGLMGWRKRRAAA